MVATYTVPRPAGADFMWESMAHAVCTKCKTGCSQMITQRDAGMLTLLQGD